MKELVCITGTSQGIGLAAAKKFIEKGFRVVGVDVNKEALKSSEYTHIQLDIKEASSILKNYQFDYIVHNAGTQSEDDKCFSMLENTIRLDESLRKNNKKVKAITFNTSISAIYGDEFPWYVAAKAGLNGYMKYVAKQLMPSGIANAVCFGGVLTELNKPILEDERLKQQVLSINPLKKWMTVEEAANWIYFVTVENTFATGQCFEIDGGENSCPESRFIWPKQ